MAIDGNWKKLLRDMEGFHAVTCYGDYLREVGYALKRFSGCGGRRRRAGSHFPFVVLDGVADRALLRAIEKRGHFLLRHGPEGFNDGDIRLELLHRLDA